MIKFVVLVVVGSAGFFSQNNSFLLELGAWFLHCPKYMSVIRGKGEEMLVVSETTSDLEQQGVWR